MPIEPLERTARRFRDCDLSSALDLTFRSDGTVALWVDSQEKSAAGALLLAIPDSAGRVRRRRVPVMLAEVRDLIDPLLELHPSAPAPPAAHCLAALTRMACRAIGNGRVVPRPAGSSAYDAPAETSPTTGALPDENSRNGLRWAIGPWTPEEATDLAAIAAALPAALRCEPVAEGPLRVPSAMDVITRFTDAVATAMVATPASHGRALRLDSEALADLEARLVGTGPVLVARITLERAGATMHLDIRNRVDHTARCSAAELWASPENATLIGNAEPDLWLLRRLRELARVWEPIGRLLTQAAPSELELEDDELTDLVLDGLEILNNHDVEVLLPRDLVKALSLTASVSAASTQSDSSGAFALESLCDVEVTASVDGRRLTDNELELLVNAQREIVRIRGHFVRVDPRLAGRLRRRLSTAEALGAALGGSLVIDGKHVPFDPAGALSGLVERVRDLSRAHSAQSVESVVGLRADLRPYQQRGVAWLRQVSALLGGGILADDMGLGKTLQIIALHLLRHGTPERVGPDPADSEVPDETSEAAMTGCHPTLVVGPASLVANWLHELERFAPEVTAHRYHGPSRSLEGIGDSDIVVTTYSTLRIDQTLFAQHRWGLVVADEAQHLKNNRSATARAMRTVPCDVRIAVTGTPVENRLGDLWSLMDWALPGVLGSQAAFRRRFTAPIERDESLEASEILSRTIAPFVLRRTKSDPAIAPDLPPRTEVDHLVPLSAEQAALYQAMTANVLEQIEHTTGIQRRGLVLKLLGGLKQICDHPALWLDQPDPLPDRSGKLAAFEELVEEMSEAGDAILVFTQYVRMGHLLGDRLAHMGIESVFLHGGTTLAKRQQMVDRFQDPAGPQVMIISIKAGGTGLNLTRANQVIHYDRWWNPAVENQASDRAWRIGQQRSVFVHRLTTEGTLEETIASELARKSQLAESIVGSGEGWITDLDDDILRSLVVLDGQDS